MAKVSARGAHKVAEARFAHETSETVRALCSDGRILQRTIFRDAGPGRRSYASRFVHYATLRNPATPENIATWVALMLARKWSAHIL